jgi:hypothetical protein
MLVHISMFSFCLFLPELHVVQLSFLIFIGEKVMHIPTLHLISHHMSNFNYSNFGSGTCGSFGNNYMSQNNWFLFMYTKNNVHIILVNNITVIVILFKFKFVQCGPYGNKHSLVTV